MRTSDFCQSFVDVSGVQRAEAAVSIHIHLFNTADVFFSLPSFFFTFSFEDLLAPDSKRCLF